MNFLCGLLVRVPGYRRYHIFWEVVGLERGPLSLVTTIEELLVRKSSGSSLESRYYCRGDPSRWPHGTHYSQKLVLTLLTCVGLLVSIVCLRTKATKVFFKCSICRIWGSHSDSSYEEAYSRGYEDHIASIFRLRISQAYPLTLKSGDMFLWSVCQRTIWHCITGDRTLQSVVWLYTTSLLFFWQF
jgi:hypothetical protein